MCSHLMHSSAHTIQSLSMRQEYTLEETLMLVHFLMDAKNVIAAMYCISRDACNSKNKHSLLGFYLFFFTLFDISYYNSKTYECHRE